MKTAIDYTSRPKRLHASRESLQALWEQGLKGRELLTEHTKIVDSFISDAFSACPEANKNMALVALGGYGRAELFPFSDIDIMLLYTPEVEAQVPAIVKSVFYPLWDAGLEVGHSVRTVEACLADAESDFLFQVSLVDARFICGDRSLFSLLRDEFNKSLSEDRKKSFVENMISRREERQRRFGSHSYLLEPNIKESRGGLRDIHAVLWTSKVLFGLGDARSLEGAGIITARERADMEESWDFLVQIRNRLHYVKSGKNDRLFFEYQEEIARSFDCKDSNNMLAVEDFMRKLHRCLQTLAVISDLFFEYIEELLHLSTCNTEDLILEPGIGIISCHIAFTDPSLLKKYPPLSMRIFVQAARTGLPIHYQTRRIINSSLELIDEKLRSSRQMAGAFMEVLQGGNRPVDILETMLDTGLLSAYIPEFSGVRFLAQHDVYHIYTVDRHLVQTVAELHELEEKEHRIFKALKSPHILYLAALLHDIGKGLNGHHAERGAEIVRDIGERMGLSPQENASLSFLVHNHLYLLHISMRRDLEDEALILKCARRIRDLERLDMLYLLSIADSKATGPGAWNDWKAALLQELYLKISLFLEGSELIDPDRVQAIEWMRDQIASRLGERGQERLAIMPDDYILSFTPEAIERHIRLKPRLSEQPSLLLAEDRESYWSLLVMARDRTGLLAKIFGVLALHNLNVLAAQIFTLKDGTAVDVLDVKSSVDEDYDVQDWDTLKKDLNLALDDRLGLTHRLAKKHRPVKLGDWQRHPRHQSEVVLDNETSDLYTILEVYAEDRTGLLYAITHTLADFGIGISRAKIGSKSDQVVDVFYIQDKRGQKISAPDLQKEIQDALLYAVDHEAF